MPNLRQKISQLICIGFHGSQLNDAQELQDWLSASDGLGALILFDYDLQKKTYDKNIKSIEQLRQLTTDIKAFYQSHHQNAYPIWLAIDIEGGCVDRLARTQGYVPVPSSQEMAQLNDEQRQSIWHQTASVLNQLNIDINFAPVVDLDLSKNRGIFGPLKRCFSDDPTVVAKLSQEYLEILNQYHILGCLKHFPGHGSAMDDSHLDFVDVTDSFVFEELIPYQELCKQSKLLFSIMTAHVINRNLDDRGLPATLSYDMLTNILRKEFNYQGIIISDDLQMHAISKYFSRREALLQTFLAGTDMVIFANQLGWDTPKDVIDDIEYLVHDKSLDENIIEQAYQRVVGYKKMLSAQ